MRFPWQKKVENDPEIDENDAIDDILEAISQLSKQLEEVKLIVNRIDQHYYKGKKGSGEAPGGPAPGENPNEKLLRWINGGNQGPLDLQK